ncbi:MAG: SAM-dependent methyltransferase [Bryobacteraceae bacterium]|jgi:precorrin-2 methylase
MKFIDFIIDLADPRRLSQFTRDPDGLMNAAGLSARQKEALRTGNSASIRILAERELNMPRTGEGVPIEQSDDIDELVRLRSAENAEDIVIDELDISDHVTTPLEETESKERTFAELTPVQQPLPGSGMPASAKAGSLTIIGTGIKAIGHVTKESQQCLEEAQKVLYLVADPVTERWIRRLNPTAESLYGYYGDDKPRSKTYQEMADRIMYFVRKKLRVCAAFYGHPGIFVSPSYICLKVLREEGYKAEMMPGISAIDSLFCDLGLDPFRGTQIFESTNLLIRARKINTSSFVILLQVASVGDLGFRAAGFDKRNLPVLMEHLSGLYGLDHELFIYQAAHYPVCRPVIRKIPVSKLCDSQITGISTLCIPPLQEPPIDQAMLARLGLA